MNANDSDRLRRIDDSLSEIVKLLREFRAEWPGTEQGITIRNLRFRPCTCDEAGKCDCGAGPV